MLWALLWQQGFLISSQTLTIPSQESWSRSSPVGQWVVKSSEASESRRLQVPRRDGQTRASSIRPAALPPLSGETRLRDAELTAGACVYLGWFKRFYFL